MCAIYPEALSEKARQDAKSSAEVMFYDKLSSQLSSDWMVVYSIAWLGYASGEYPGDGETDFIAAHPEKGALIIEVKGGRIRYDGRRRQWISKDKRGIDYDIDPFRQVVDSKYALLRKLKALIKKVHKENSPLLNEIQSLSGKKSKFIPLYHAVAFPEVISPNYSVTPDSPRQIVIDKNDMHNLERKLENIFNYWRGSSKGSFRNYQSLVDTLEHLLAKSTCLHCPLRSQAEEEEKDIINLTEEQFRLLDVLCRHRFAAIGVCAGSGKTMMAVEKARRLAGKGYKTLLTCFNRLLAGHLQEILKGEENLIVMNYHSLCADLCGQAGIEPEWKGGDKEFYDKVLPKAMFRALKEN